MNSNELIETIAFWMAAYIAIMVLIVGFKEGRDND